MSEKITSAPATAIKPSQPCDSVCIQTDQIYDSCREKDCLEDLSVIFNRSDQDLINRAINVKCRSAQVLWVYADVEAVPFNKGFYSVDIKYFFRVVFDVFTGVSTPTQATGLAMFDKKVILFGSEGNAKIFSSKYKPHAVDTQLVQKSNLPKAVVETVDPICLGAKLVEPQECCCGIGEELGSIPEFICGCFDDELVSPRGNKNVLVSLGLFTIVKLERETQLLMPAYDFCIPQKECISATDHNPCDLFERIAFPFDEFYPPQKEDFHGEELDYRSQCK